MRYTLEGDTLYLDDGYVSMSRSEAEGLRDYLNDSLPADEPVEIPVFAGTFDALKGLSVR